MPCLNKFKKNLCLSLMHTLDVDWIFSPNSEHVCSNGSLYLLFNLHNMSSDGLVSWWSFKSRQHLRSSGQVPTFASVHSWQLYSAAPLVDEAVSTMTQSLTQSLS